MTLSFELATPPKSTKSRSLKRKSTKSRSLDLSVSRGTDSNGDFGLIWICAREFEFLDSFDFGGVAFSVDTVIQGGEDS